ISALPKDGKLHRDKFGSTAEIFKATTTQLTEVEGIGEKTAYSILQPDLEKKAEEEIRRTQKEGVQIIIFDSPFYPSFLKSIPDPPIVLYVKGEIETISSLSVGVVGTRRPSYYGTSFAEKITSGLSSVGLTIVSGLALGIDTTAHSTALKCKTKTIAVLPTGMDSIYPPENKKLAEQIVTQGALVSEFPYGLPVRREFFSRRNRIITGISQCLVVIEAPFGSGALITAQYAADYGRDVFALPGRVDSHLSKGTNRLIKDGAMLIENADDVLARIAPQLIAQKRELDEQSEKEEIFIPNLSEIEKEIYKAVELDPKNIDDIAVECKRLAQEVSATLLALQLKKLVVQLPGNMYVRK
ncbi:MAG: DNA-processing protein DprA, partial [Planctomycetota bacterium]